MVVSPTSRSTWKPSAAPSASASGSPRSSRYAIVAVGLVVRGRHHRDPLDAVRHRCGVARRPRLECRVQRPRAQRQTAQRRVGGEGDARHGVVVDDAALREGLPRGSRAQASLRVTVRSSLSSWRSSSTRVTARVRSVTPGAKVRVPRRRHVVGGGERGAVGGGEGDGHLAPARGIEGGRERQLPGPFRRRRGGDGEGRGVVVVDDGEGCGRDGEPRGDAPHGQRLVSPRRERRRPGRG